MNLLSNEYNNFKKCYKNGKPEKQESFIKLGDSAIFLILLKQHEGDIVQL